MVCERIKKRKKETGEPARQGACLNGSLRHLASSFVNWGKDKTEGGGRKRK